MSVDPIVATPPVNQNQTLAVEVVKVPVQVDGNRTVEVSEMRLVPISNSATPISSSQDGGRTPPEDSNADQGLNPTPTQSTNLNSPSTIINNTAPASNGTNTTQSGSSLIQSDGNGIYTIGSHGPSLSLGAIIGICIGAGVAFLLLLFCLTWCCCRRSRRKKQQKLRTLQLESAARPPPINPMRECSNTAPSFSPFRITRGSVPTRNGQAPQQCPHRHSDDSQGQDADGRSSREEEEEAEKISSDIDEVLSTYEHYFDERRTPSNPIQRDPFADGSRRYSRTIGFAPSHSSLTRPTAALAPLKRARGSQVPIRVAFAPTRPINAPTVIRFQGKDSVDERKAEIKQDHPPITTKFVPLHPHHFSRDTMASVYSMESAQENHDYGEQTPPMPTMRRYI